MPRALKPENLSLTLEEISDILIENPDVVDEYPVYRFSSVLYASDLIYKILSKHPVLVDYFDPFKIRIVDALNLIEQHPHLTDKLTRSLFCGLSSMELLRGRPAEFIELVKSALLRNTKSGLDVYVLLRIFPELVVSLDKKLLQNIPHVEWLVDRQPQLVEYLKDSLTGLDWAQILSDNPNLIGKLPLERIKAEDIAQIRDWNFTLFKLYITKLFQ